MSEPNTSDAEANAFNAIFTGEDEQVVDEGVVKFDTQAEPEREKPEPKAEAKAEAETEEPDAPEQDKPDGGKDKPLPKELQSVMTKLRQKDKAELDALKQQFGKKAEAYDALMSDPRFVQHLRRTLEPEPEKPEEKSAIPEDLAEEFERLGLVDPKHQKLYFKTQAKLFEKLSKPMLEALKQEVMGTIELKEKVRNEYDEVRRQYPDFESLRDTMQQVQERYGYQLPFDAAYRLAKAEYVPAETATEPPAEEPTRVDPTPKKNNTDRLVRKAAARQQPGPGSGAIGARANETEEQAFERAYREIIAT